MRQCCQIVCVCVLLAAAALAMIQPSTSHAQSPVHGTFPLLITELMPNPAGSDEGAEWVELSNLSDAPIFLGDLFIGDAMTASHVEGMWRFPLAAWIEANSTIVVAQSASQFHQRYGRTPDFALEPMDGTEQMAQALLWGRGDLKLANNGDDLALFDDSFRLLDGVSYGERTTLMSPAPAAPEAGVSLERQPAGCDTDTALEWHHNASPSPGTLPNTTPCPAEWQPSVQAIGAIAEAVDTGQMVTVTGIVTGRYSYRNQNGVTFHTLFIQNDAATRDHDPTTPDGIAVFVGVDKPDVVVGDLVRVAGQLITYEGLMEFSHQQLSVRLIGRGMTLPEPQKLDTRLLAIDDSPFIKQWVGMRVRVSAARAAGPTHAGCGFAITTDMFHALPFVADGQNAFPVLQVRAASNHACLSLPDVQVGDVLEELEGVLTYQFGAYVLILDENRPVSHTPIETTLPPPLPPLTATVRIVSLNLENHFDTHKDTTHDGEPVYSAARLSQRERKFAALIGQQLGCPTVVGIIEVEHAHLLHSLAEQSAAHCGFVYSVLHIESPDARGIDVAYLVNPTRVDIDSFMLMQHCYQIETGIVDAQHACPVGLHPLFSRPPLRLSAMIDGEAWIFYLNHFKSKRGSEFETAARRLAQAEHLARLAESELVREEAARVVLFGDFNTTPESAPMQIMEMAGRMENILLSVPQNERYSFIFGGVAELIDGMLLSPALVEGVTSVGVMHVNAGLPAGWRDDPSPQRLLLRSSDHDIPYFEWRQPEAAELLEEVEVAATEPSSELVEVKVAEKEPLGQRPVSQLNQTGSVAGLILSALLLLGGLLSRWIYKRFCH